MLDARGLVGTHDVLFVTLDTLRYDVAARLHAAGRTPGLSAVLPPGGWERRHSPGSFTFAAHVAFIAGFFSKLRPLGRVLPGLLDESHWSPELGVTDPRSTEHQVNVGLQRVAATERRVFLFVNVSAIHQPNRGYVDGAEEDTIATHAAALEYADGHLARLFAGLRRRGPWLVVMCSDHGTAYGEDGFVGHRLAHPVVWLVRRWYADALATLTNLPRVAKAAAQTNLSGKLDWLGACDRAKLALWCTSTPARRRGRASWRSAASCSSPGCASASASWG